MVDPSTIGMVFAIIGVISTMVWYGLALLGIKKLDDLRAVVGDSSESRSAPGAANENLMETARERYARGDIGEEEFERMTERLLETEDAADGSVERTLERE